MVRKRKEMQLLDMKEEKDDTLEIDLEDFKEVLNTVAKKSTKTYDFFLKKQEINTKMPCLICAKE